MRIIVSTAQLLLLWSRVPRAEYGHLLILFLCMQPNTPTRPAVLHADALSSVPRALTGLVYQHHSLHAARRFVHKFFLSREVDLRNMIKFRDPKVALQATVEKFGRERPVSRYCRFAVQLRV